MHHAPATVGERAQVLDALRGFAVFGILLANIQHFSGWAFIDDGRKAALPAPALNEATEFAIAFLVDGKFYSIFSLLFGIGFAVLLTRSQQAGRDFEAFFRRRMRVLLGIALVHAVLVWYGDILTLYALLGFTLVAFNRRSDATLLRWVAVLIALPTIQYVAMVLAFGGPAGAGPGPAQAEMMATVVRVFETGSWPQITLYNIGGLVLGRYPDLLFSGRIFKVLAMFLLGLVIGRRQVWLHLDPHLPLLRRVALLGFALGLPLNFALALLMRTDAYGGLQPLGIVQSVVYGIGVPALALAYVCSFALLHHSGALALAMRLLAPVGRMALTNYLMHSVVCCLVFYGYGGGVFGRVGLFHAMGVAVAVLAAQVVLSSAWLRYYRFGPAEWLWRSITYGTRQPMRLADSARPLAEPA